MSNPWAALADVGESFADYIQEKDKDQFNDYLSKLDLPEKFLVWLYSPIISLSIEDIRTIKAKYNVPDNVIILKLIAHYIYEVSDTDDELTEDDIYQNVMDKLLASKLLDLQLTSLNTVENSDVDLSNVDLSNVDLSNVDLSNHKELRALYDRCKHVKLRDASVSKVKQLLKMSHYLKAIWTQDHQGYPLPHPKLGRPQIGYCICLFEGCNHRFPDGDDLKDHLEELGKHTKNFHKFHEEEVVYRNLTPEKIKAENITRCPALICDKANHVFTPDELIYHFTLLGIPPFWKQGQIVSNIYEKEMLNNDIFKCIYATDECSICMNRESEVLFLPCFHNVTCLNCCGKIRNNKCPICSTAIKACIPF